MLWNSAGTDMDYNRTNIEETFRTGSTNGSDQCVSIGINEDNALEGEQTFIVFLTTSDPDVLLPRNTTIVEITDNDGSYINFSRIIQIWPQV